MLLRTSLLLLASTGFVLSSEWPWNLQLTPKASGMQGLRSVYSVDITVGRLGPLSLLVDTGSPAVVVQGDFGGTAGAASFLGIDNGGAATIHYGGSTVTGDVSKNRLCFDSAKGACLKNFPIFQVQSKDSGFNQLGLDGVLGLAPASGEVSLGLNGMDETLLDGLASSGSGVPRIFGLFISPGSLFGPSMLSLGGYDATKILPGVELQYIPLAQPSTGRWELTLQSVKLAPADGGELETVDVCQGMADCRVLLDSGTAQLASVPSLAETLSSKVRNDAGCLELRAMPDIHIEFAGGIVFKLGPEDYVIDKNICSLAMDELTSEELARQKSLALILGEPFLQKVYAVFDQDQKRVGLAPSAAMSGQQTLNEQHRASEAQEKAEHSRASLMNYISGR